MKKHEKLLLFAGIVIPWVVFFALNIISIQENIPGMSRQRKRAYSLNIPGGNSPAEEENSIPPEIKRAHILRADRDLEEASRTVLLFLKKNPENEEALILLGEILGEMEEYEKAEKYIKQCLENTGGKHRDWALRALGKIYLESGRLDEAEECLLASVKESRNDIGLAYANFELGKIYLQTHKKKEAMDCIRTAAALHSEPGFAELYNKLEKEE